MHKRIIIVGRAASGKDHIRKKFEAQGFRYAVSYTTRPPREGEVDGVDYIFISPEEAQVMIKNDEFYEYVEFNGWLYGTSIRQFDEDDVFIMTPTGLAHVDEDSRRKSFVIFIDIDEDVRRERMAGRNMPGDSVDRRIEADRKDFENFTNYNIRITNPDF
jgi:guanylate kinase